MLGVLGYNVPIQESLLKLELEQPPTPVMVGMQTIAAMELYHGPFRRHFLEWEMGCHYLVL